MKPETFAELAMSQGPPQEEALARDICRNRPEPVDSAGAGPSQ